jgi:PAS domain S-box-containing protein
MRMVAVPPAGTADSGRRLDALFAAARDAILMIDDRGRYVDANPAALALLGYERDELLSMKSTDILPARGRTRLREDRRLFGQDGAYAGEYSLMRKDGTLVDTEFRAVANILPGLHLAIVRDVSDRKRADEELRRSRRVLEEAQEVAHIGGWEWDVVGNQLTWTRETFRIFGCTPESYRPAFATVMALIHPDDRAGVEEVNERARRGGKDFAYDARILRPGGGMRWIHARGHAERNSARQVVRVMGIVQDITERRASEDLRKRLVDRLISAHEQERSRISRELHDGPGQSLTALLVGLRGIEDAQTLAGARLSAARQRELVAQIMDELSRLARGLRPTVLDDLGLLAALQLASDQAGLFGFEVTLEAKDIGRLPTEVETTFYRVVQETLTNAARHARARLVRIKVERRRDEARLTVTDDGCGFDVDRVLGGGVHLGLHGIRERAELLAGKADIQSKPGEGTTIMVTVPLKAAPRGKPKTAPERPKKGRAR